MQAINQRLRYVPSWVIYPLALLPLLWLVWRGVMDDLGVDPVKEVEHSLGLTALQLLVIGLAITPLRWLTKVNLIRYRRAVGLMAFFYVALHLAVWLLLDIQLRWGEIWADILRRPYITIGMLGFAVMIPLAITSNNASIKRLGSGWRRLHQLTYLAALAGGVHFLLVVKAWPAEPLLYLGGILVLLALRLSHSFARWP